MKEHNYSLSNSCLQPNSWGGERKSKKYTKIRICLHTKIRGFFLFFYRGAIPLRSEQGYKAKMQNNKAVWKNKPAREKKKSMNTQELTFTVLATAENSSGNISSVIVSSPCFMFHCLCSGLDLIPNNLLRTKRTSGEKKVQAFMVLLAFSHW